MACIKAVSRNTTTTALFVNAERIYLAAWKQHNRNSNSLERILWSDALRKSQKHYQGVSLRDEAVAASIIQWLATNVGHGFLLSVERKVGRADFEAVRRNEEGIAVRCVQALHRQKRASARQAFLRKRETREHLRVAQNAIRQAEMVKRDAERELRRKKSSAPSSCDSTLHSLKAGL